MTELSLGAGLVIYLIIIVVAFILFYFLIGLNLLPSVVLSLLIGIVILSIIFPVSQLTMMNSSDTTASIYSIIYILTALIILFYLLYTSLRDYKHKNVSPKYEKFMTMCTGAGCLGDEQ